MKKLLVMALALCMVMCALAGCAPTTDPTDPTGTDNTETGSVYYLNFKPEQDEAWQQLAKKYTDETGVAVTVLTAAQGTYEETLTAEMNKSEAPTLFQISGQIALESWKDYCLDLSSSAVYSQLTSDDFAIKEGDAVYGIAYVYEGF
ncbi:MAG: extracellular solute-binding protein, partial [Clostridia bacterium]|nr:extracellular solute-binding protein [Clostridia bacterium]